MGPELDEDGWVKNPIRLDWASGACFVTPPGWWHSHHNDSEVDAWVLPLQDAGLHTHMRTLNIEFSVAQAGAGKEASSPAAATAPSSSDSTSSSDSAESDKTTAALTSP
jgi:gentisate 1,2-dioxygenase